MPAIFNYLGGGLEYLYHSTMDYLLQQYHMYSTNLIDIPLSDVELPETAYYDAMANDIAASHTGSSSVPIGKLVV